MRLNGKVALVTGAGGGLGTAISKRFAVEGASLICADRDGARAEATASAIAKAGGSVRAFRADVADPVECEAQVAEAVRQFGRIDIVVNNAGGTAPRPFLDTTPGYFERAFHFNVTTAFALSRLVAPHLLKTATADDPAAIVNISSAIGRLRDRGFVAYGTAKAAMLHLTRLMAIDFAPRIRVNAIAVGSVATSSLETVLTNDDLQNEMVARTPLHRLGDPEDIALAALYLASSAGSFITGKVLEVDGGIEAPNLALGLPDL